VEVTAQDPIELQLKRFSGLDKPQELVMAEKKLPPIHPGEILLEEFLIPMEIS
jgi:hypothetical protein